MKWILVAALATSCTTGKAVNTDCVSIDEQSKKIELGMTEQEVIEIMGRPDGIQTWSENVRFSYARTYDGVHFVVRFYRNSVTDFGLSKDFDPFDWQREDWQ